MFWVAPLCLLGSGLESVAWAQAQAAPPPSAPVAASPPPAAGDDGWTAAPPPAPAAPAAPAAAPSPAPAAPPPGAPAAAAPTIAVAPAAPATAATPPAPRDEYDGPPLLLGRKKQHVGGYGGPIVAYSRMLDRDGVLVGAEGALLLDHRLSLGFAGYGFSRTPSGPPRANGMPREYATGYGGFLVRYAAFADFPVYGSLGLLIGGGGVTLAPDHDYDDDDWDDDWDDDNWDDEDFRGYFVVQPDISLYTNATRWLRFGFTAGYRFATEVDEYGFDASALSGVVLGGTVQAGWL
jgi:hypothetical protein